MKKQFLFFVGLIILNLSLLAQEVAPPKVKFEKVAEAEMAMKSYPGDTTAVAVILYDEGSSYVKYDVSNGFMLNYQRFVRIKILKSDGVDWGNFRIPIYANGSNKEDIYQLKGTTFNIENGKIIKSELSKEAIFRERENKYWEMVRFSMPAVKVGSVIDVQYRIVTDRIWELTPWKFQYTIPVQWSQYSVSYPEYYTYNQTSTGSHPLVYKKEGQKEENITYTEKFDVQDVLANGNGSQRQILTIKYLTREFEFASANVPAIKEEPYLTSIDNYGLKLKFELANYNFTRIGGDFKNFTTTWNDLAKVLNGSTDFGDAMKSINYAKPILAGLTGGATTELQKVKNIYSHLQSTMNWDSYRSIFTTKSPKDIYEKKKGNSADINLMLVAWLRESGLNANPVVLSTRDNGLLSTYRPSLTDCNYVIVQVTADGKKYLLDATESKLQPGLLPYRCLNGKGIVMIGEIAEQVDLANPRCVDNFMVTVDMVDGKLSGQIQQRKSGYSAYSFRESVKSAGGEKEYFKKMQNSSPDINYIDYQFTNLDSLLLPAQAQFKVELSGAEEAGVDAGIIYIDPVLVNRLKENPFTSPTREFPVDYGYPFQDIYNFQMTIPEGYAIEEIPKNLSLALPEYGGSFQYKISQVGNKIVLNMLFSVDKPMFVPQEYENLKSYYNMVINKQAEQIVLKKTAI